MELANYLKENSNDEIDLFTTHYLLRCFTWRGKRCIDVSDPEEYSGTSSHDFPLESDVLETIEGEIMCLCDLKRVVNNSRNEEFIVDQLDGKFVLEKVEKNFTYTLVN